MQDDPELLTLVMKDQDVQGSHYKTLEFLAKLQSDE